jgi:hypothetical protein
LISTQLFGSGLVDSNLESSRLIFPQYLPNPHLFPIYPIDRVVYTAHDYGFLHKDVENATIFNSEVRERWLHVAEHRPLFLGEFGASNPDDLFWNKMVNTIITNPTLHWSIWTLDGTNGFYREGFIQGESESYGLLNGDWTLYRDSRVDAILQAPLNINVNNLGLNNRPQSLILNVFYFIITIFVV